MADEGTFTWHELVTGDQKTSGAFFGELFGWTRKEVETGLFGTYTLFQKNGEDVAGMMNPTRDTPNRSSHWHFYIAVEDVEELVERARSLGGSVVVAPHDVPGVGRVCAVADPTGAITHALQRVKR